MHIRQVTIQIPDPEETAMFFSRVFGSRQDVGATSILLTIGTSYLSLEQGDSQDEGYYHLAFDIPENVLLEARDLLRKDVATLPAGDDGIVTASPSWDAHSVYFNAPGGLNLELIARHRLPNAIRRPFAFTDILNISEVGVPVNDPIESAHDLKTIFGLDPFNEPSETFAPVGSDDGLIILVKEGRIWFPTDNQPTTDRPLRITLGDVNGHAVLGSRTIVTSA